MHFMASFMAQSIAKKFVIKAIKNTVSFCVINEIRMEKAATVKCGTCLPWSFITE